MDLVITNTILSSPITSLAIKSTSGCLWCIPHAAPLEPSKVQCTAFTFVTAVGVIVWDVPQSCHHTGMVWEPLWQSGVYTLDISIGFAGGTIGQTG